jgi:NAD(P)-dependent dehydrogenase (short-subunit alcohol dehydrogenase family)
VGSLACSLKTERVFVTGRSADDITEDRITGIRCDHWVDDQVAAEFGRVVRETGKVDVLVNNVWGGDERMVEDGAFTWTKPFWDQPLWRWDAMFSAGGCARTISQASLLQNSWSPNSELASGCQGERH